MVRKIIQLSVLSFCISCNSEVNEDMVTYKDQRTYLKRTGKLFTGQLTRRFENGRIASLLTYKDGLLNGKWYTKGYNGELIQEGEYWDLKSIRLESVDGITFNSFSLWKEGDITFVTLDVTGEGNNYRLDTSKCESLYNKNLRSYNREYAEIRLFKNDSLIDTYTTKNPASGKRKSN